VYDSLTLAAVLTELNREAVGLRINKLRQPDDLTVVLHLGGAGGVRQRILACADAAAFRLHLIAEAPPNPDVPPAFSQKARPLLEGARLIEVAQPNFDRVAMLTCEKGPGLCTVIVELMGRRSNIILVEGSGRIVDAAKRITPKESRDRPISPGRRYAPPPAGGRLSPLTAIPAQIEALAGQAPRDEPLATFLHRTYHGFSKDLVGEFAGRIEVEPQTPMGSVDLSRLVGAFQWLSALVSTEAFEPVLCVDANGAPTGARALGGRNETTGLTPIESISRALELYYAGSLEAGEFARARNELAQLVRSEAKRRRKTFDAICRDIERNRDHERLRRCGEMILANLHRISRGDPSVTLTDAYDPNQFEITIDLAPDRSPQENAQDYFVRARKAQRAVEHGERRRDEIGSSLRALDEIPARIEQTTNAEELDQFRQAAYGLDVPRPRDATPEPQRRARDELAGKGIRRRTSRDGFEILWGKSATGNDYLTVHASGPDDIWLHARGCASAHVVIRTNGAPERVPKTTIEEAARIAAQTSEAKHSSLVAVDYTLRKHVRRFRKSKPGLVHYERETTLHITP
jgi:predicted ribosome quality control (RQC) complex YloA/Tae2 family protein